MFLWTIDRSLQQQVEHCYPNSFSKFNGFSRATNAGTEVEAHMGVQVMVRLAAVALICTHHASQSGRKPCDVMHIILLFPGKPCDVMHRVLFISRKETETICVPFATSSRVTQGHACSRSVWMAAVQSDGDQNKQIAMSGVFSPRGSVAAAAAPP